jgi:hypothetical protein
VGNSSKQPANDTSQWHLPTFDPRNETKYLYRLNSMDIYFWTKEDAQQFLNAARRVLPPSQVRVLDEPEQLPAYTNTMSPVVQRLENVAISDPGYRDGRTRNSKTTSTLSFPGPPGSATPAASENSAEFAPMAYNPAAPAAPEAIRHREKTPPPEDGTANPLTTAAAMEQGQLPHHIVLPPPPQFQQRYSGFGVSSSIQSPGLQSPYNAPLPSAGLQSPYGQPTLQHATGFPPPPPSATQAATPQVSHINYPGSPGLANPMASPLGSPIPSGSHAPLQSPPITSPPPGGFSSYQYTTVAGQPLSNDYSIHQQVYRPTEGESTVKFSDKPPGQPRGKFEDRAEKVEKRVGGFLKKFEKRYG